MIYDAIIAGGGPAGYSAALYLAQAGYRALVIERLTDGGQAALTDIIENYPGFDEGIGGFELGAKMKRGAERFGAEVVYSSISELSLGGDIKRAVADGKEYLAHSVIIATGAAPRRLGLDKEEELTGSGIHYCAHCDGRFYQGKRVAVIGGGNSALEDAAYLSKLASEVILIHRRYDFRATKLNQKRIENLSNLKVIFGSTLSELITNGGRLTGILINKDGAEERIDLDGVFISIGRTPQSELVSGQLNLDGSGYIVADESTRTNIEGVFAAGDIRTKLLRQVVTAVADGAVAAVMAEEYISRKTKK